MAARRWLPRRLPIAALLAVLLAGPGETVAYPERPVTFVVAFGVGGSADRMTRSLSAALAEELGQPVQVINKPGAGTLLGARHVLGRAHDGYTVLATAFSPYLFNTILEGLAEYDIEDFAYLNFQWFDEDLIALSKRSRYRSLAALLKALRERPKTVKAAVVRGSGGHLMARLLLEVSGIAQHNLNLVTYNSGGQARAAVAGGVVDFIVISARGTEPIREYITPVAIIAERRNAHWDAPTLNELLAPMGLSTPVMPGSIRGFATSRQSRQQYPERFDALAAALRRTLARPDVQRALARANIGARWLGPEASTAAMHNTFEIFEQYAYLLEWR